MAVSHVEMSKFEDMKSGIVFRRSWRTSFFPKIVYSNHETNRSILCSLPKIVQFILAAPAFHI